MPEPRFPGVLHGLAVIAGLAVLLGGCGGGGGSEVGVPATPPPDTPRALAMQQGLDGDPADGLVAVPPDSDPLVKLGQILFFSRTLSGRMDVACASCHHPELAAGDELTLPVGVAAVAPEVLGIGRALNPDLDQSPDADGGPNVPRNSQTIFNVALYNRALFHDGRVFVLDEEVVPGGQGQRIRTPESGNVADPNAGDNLLEAQAKLPLVSNDEMRGFMYPGLGTPNDYRQRLVDRLRGLVDQDYMSSDGADNWNSRFTAAFGDLDVNGNMISLARIQKALAAYQASMIFVDTPWKAYIEGDDDAISDSAKRGADLFLRSRDEGGLGCAGCHSGDHFTDEKFYNVGFPQIGRGKRTDGSDHGRADVSVVLQTDENQHAFRVPGLINVELTAPYGHAGTFANLGQLIRYHANPRVEVDYFDFDLQHLEQAQEAGVLGTDIYPQAESLTRAAIAAQSFSLAEQKLPGRGLTQQELDDLTAFLRALTDPCAASASCTAPWVPDGEADDPDGNLLVRGEPFYESGSGSSEPPPPEEPYAEYIDLTFPALDPRTTFPDAENCATFPSAVPNSGARTFLRRDAELGLDAVHGYSEASWLVNVDSDSLAIDETMEAGGITAGYFTGACRPDLLFIGGDGPDASGIVLYQNQGGQNGFVERPDLLPELPTGTFTSVSVADINGDYRRELLFGNLHQGELPIYTLDASDQYVSAGALPMGRSTFGMAFADVDGNGYPNLYLAHWSASGLPGTAPAFWNNQGGTRLVPADDTAGTSEDDITQKRNFAPGFADLNGDRLEDLAVASDFTTSVVLQNDGQGGFTNVTDRQVINDSNGMGSAIADFDNDGRLDWFVTSVELPEEYDWDGNRLYWNATASGDIVFTSDVGNDGIKDGGWGWGACAADFDNDGWLDIFHVNGFGKIPESLSGGPMDTYIEQYKPFADAFADRPPRLFINQGDGTFLERAAAWGLDVASEGRGVVCLDYDRDGDVDLGLVDHSTGIQFFENQAGAGAGRAFLNVRLVGGAPNTEALGARVSVNVDLDGDGGTEQLVRRSSANSNFASQNTTDMHFGLGSADQIQRLEVRWPDGTLESCDNVPVNRFLLFDQRDAGLACPAP